MKKALYTLLAPLSLLADPCCMPLENPSCYPYAVNPPLISRSGCTWGARLDFLYWRPSPEDNPFAEVISLELVSTPSSTTGSFSAELKEYNYDYQAGFRAGINAALPCDEWSINLDWTHFLHHAKGSVSTGASDQIALSSYLNIGTFTTSDNSIVFADSEVNSLWRIQLDVIDLVLNREFYVGHKVTLRPFGGLRAFLLRQKVEATNTIHGGALGANYQTSYTNVSAQSNFKSVGVVGGLFSSWDFFCDFGFYSEVAASAFYGKSRSNLKGYMTNTGLEALETQTFVAADYDHNVNALKFALDFGLGLQWRKQLFSSDSLVCLKAGWEEHLYFNQNTLLNLTLDEMFLGSVSQKPNSDISFQGLVISASFTY